MGDRCVANAEAAGSNPVTCTIYGLKTGRYVDDCPGAMPRPTTSLEKFSLVEHPVRTWEVAGSMPASSSTSLGESSAR